MGRLPDAKMIIRIMQDVGLVKISTCHVKIRVMRIIFLAIPSVSPSINIFIKLIILVYSYKLFVHS